MYTIKELANAGKEEFGVPSFVVAAALKATGKKKFTLEEAHKIVDEFAKQKA
ncbi:MAG: hypothetical protein IJR52_01755 [Selenomonadaceae bacterium]|nr:hypothetical protein [Selenomonadaceae bacterium]MBQ9496280.1 hypothetical protein [Selenomonadaceae bacterium]